MYIIIIVNIHVYVLKCTHTYACYIHHERARGHSNLFAKPEQNITRVRTRVHVNMNYTIIVVTIIVVCTTGNGGGSCFYTILAFRSAKLFLLFPKHKSAAELNGRLLIWLKFVARIIHIYNRMYACIVCMCI